ncbi:MAG: hypothetical protein U1G05_15985 [Kiritimatiellia bacterium]
MTLEYRLRGRLAAERRRLDDVFDAGERALRQRLTRDRARLAWSAAQVRSWTRRPSRARLQHHLDAGPGAPVRRGHRPRGRPADEACIRRDHNRSYPGQSGDPP